MHEFLWIIVFNKQELNIFVIPIFAINIQPYWACAYRYKPEADSSWWWLFVIFKFSFSMMF